MKLRDTSEIIAAVKRDILLKMQEFDEEADEKIEKLRSGRVNQVLDNKNPVEIFKENMEEKGNLLDYFRVFSGKKRIVIDNKKKRWLKIGKIGKDLGVKVFCGTGKDNVKEEIIKEPEQLERLKKLMEWGINGIGFKKGKLAADSENKNSQDFETDSLRDKNVQRVSDKEIEKDFNEIDSRKEAEISTDNVLEFEKKEEAEQVKPGKDIEMKKEDIQKFLEEMNEAKKRLDEAEEKIKNIKGFFKTSAVALKSSEEAFEKELRILRETYENAKKRHEEAVSGENGVIANNSEELKQAA